MTSRLTTGPGIRPAATSRMLPHALTPLPRKHSSVQHRACGARITFSRARIGSSGSTGSVSKTSRPAPWIAPVGAPRSSPPGR